MPFLNLFYRFDTPVSLIPALIVQNHVLHESTGEQLVCHQASSLEVRLLTFFMSDSAGSEHHTDPDSRLIQDPNSPFESGRLCLDMLMQIDDPPFLPPDLW